MLTISIQMNYKSLVAAGLMIACTIAIIDSMERSGK